MAASASAATAGGRASPASFRRSSRRAERIERLVVHVDGGARGNPGPAGIAAVLTTPDGTLVERHGEFIGSATNNVAEYRALLLGIESARRLGAEEVELVGDSELVVRQVRGEYRVKDETLRGLHAQVATALGAFRSWSIRHVKREQNAGADEMVNETLAAAGYPARR